jgi:molybdate transport system regulatory protein
MVEKNGAPFLVAGRIDLLEAVDHLGSISQAAKAVGMSYKGAWDAIDTMNNQADEALVARTPGGRRGGGTHLTAYGKRVVALVRAIEHEYQQALELLNQRAEKQGRDFAEYQRLLQRFSLQTSARNHWVGTITAVRADRVRTEVEIALDKKLSIVAHITTDSARRLGTQPGVEIAALVKAVAVQIDTDTGRSTAANRLAGTIARCSQEGGRSEVSIDLPGGRTITAVVSDVADVSLRTGRKVVASFEPRSVLLAKLPGLR